MAPWSLPRCYGQFTLSRLLAPIGAPKERRYGGGATSGRNASASTRCWVSPLDGDTSVWWSATLNATRKERLSYLFGCSLCSGACAKEELEVRYGSLIVYC